MFTSSLERYVQYIFICFSERTSGSDNASNLFQTSIYGLETYEKIDLGEVLWICLFKAQILLQKIPKFHVLVFLSIVVKHACD